MCFLQSVHRRMDGSYSISLRRCYSRFYRNGCHQNSTAWNPGRAYQTQDWKSGVGGLAYLQACLMHATPSTLVKTKIDPGSKGQDPALRPLLTAQQEDRPDWPIRPREYLESYPRRRQQRRSLLPSRVAEIILRIQFWIE